MYPFSHLLLKYVSYVADEVPFFTVVQNMEPFFVYHIIDYEPLQYAGCVPYPPFLWLFFN